MLKGISPHKLVCELKNIYNLNTHEMNSVIHLLATAHNMLKAILAYEHLVCQ